MAIKKFYSNKPKAGWRENSSHVPPENLPKGKKQKPHQKKYYSWGYDIDLAPVARDTDGKPLRNRSRESGFASKKQAEAATGRIRLGEKNRRYELTDPASYPLLRDLFQKRIKTITEHQEKTRAYRVLQLLLDLLADNGFENLRVNELTTAMINLYVSHRRYQETNKIKDSTINRDLRCVGATLGQFINFYSGFDDYKKPKIPYIKTDKTRREKVLQPVEVNAILFHLTKPPKTGETDRKYISRFRIGLLFALAAVTGARPGEIARIKESDILFVINALKITGRKTRFMTAKTVRYFPLVPLIRQILTKALEIKLMEYIFTEKGTLTNTYYEPIKQACADAGIVYGRDVSGGIIPYDLRHTATTLLVQSGADFETITSLTGQSRHSLWHYTHASNESIERGANILEKFGVQCFENIADGLRLDTKEKMKKLSASNGINKN